MLDRREVRVRPDLWEPMVQLGLLEPKVIPASKVRSALLGQLEQQVPLALRVRKAQKAMQALREHKDRKAP